MLIQFSVKNFRSFKDQTVLSLVANASKDNPQNVAKCNNSKLLKQALIFGPNAAKKVIFLKL